MRPKGVDVRRRLLFQDVDNRPGEAPSIECLQQVGLDEMAAAADIDQTCAVRKRAEGARVQNAAGVCRERQQADEDVEPGKERLELRLAGVAIHPNELFRRPAPARALEAQRAEPVKRRRPEHAHPHHAYAPIAAWPHPDLAPDLFALLLRVIEQVPMQREHREGHVVNHGLRNAWLDHADERQIRRQAREIEMVDAGCNREEHLGVRELLQEVGRRLPKHEILNALWIADLWPHPKLDLGRLPRENLAPFAAALLVCLVDENWLGHACTRRTVCWSSRCWR